MHYTLHLTDGCNLKCRYCYVKQNQNFMNFDTAKSAVDMAVRDNGGIVFFGGEPLLCRELIYKTVEYAKDIKHFKITTNGTLLDSEFMDFAVKHNIFIAISHDGTKTAHDMNRCGSYDMLLPKIELLLKAQPCAPVMMTVSPNTVNYYYDGVKHLIELGFRYIICSMNYAGDWDSEALTELKRQYRKLAQLYKHLTLTDKKFYLSPFEVKFASHIRGASFRSERCELGKKQISVAPDGKLYPCVQFVGDENYVIGNVHKGIDAERRNSLFQINDNEKDSCRSCAVSSRCNHHCGCLNKQSTGSITEVAPSLCAHERILIPIADRLAEELFREHNGLFIQKQYNDMYPVLSLIDEKAYRGKHITNNIDKAD